MDFKKYKTKSLPAISYSQCDYVECMKTGTVGALGWYPDIVFVSRPPAGVLPKTVTIS